MKQLNQPGLAPTHQKTNNMTTLARLTIGLILALLASSCMLDVNWGSGVRGNGVVVEESRPIPESFTGVTASEGLDVFVSQGPEFGIRVEADENVIELIGTEIRDGKLRVHAIKNIGRATKNIYVTLPEITALYASSGADLKVKGSLETDKIPVKRRTGDIARFPLPGEPGPAPSPVGQRP